MGSHSMPSVRLKMIASADENDLHSKAVLSTAVCVTLTTLMVIVVSARIFLRFRSRHYGADEYVMVFSMLFCIIYNALAIIQTRYDPGNPKNTETNADGAKYTRINFAGRFFYQIGIGGFKVALCVSYLRLISGTTRTTYRFIIWSVLAITVLGNIASTLVVLFNCKPVSLSWDPTVLGKCLPTGPMNYSRAGIGIACDIIVMFLPIPLVLALEIQWGQKVGVICLFLLGFFTTFCSIMRLRQISTLGKGDPTMFVIWSTAEFNVGNMVCGLPYLQPVFKTLLRRFQSRMQESRLSFVAGGYTLRPFRTGSEELREPISTHWRITPIIDSIENEDLFPQTRSKLEHGIQKTIHIEIV